MKELRNRREAISHRKVRGLIDAQANRVDGIGDARLCHWETEKATNPADYYTVLGYWLGLGISGVSGESARCDAEKVRRRSFACSIF